MVWNNPIFNLIDRKHLIYNGVFVCWWNWVTTNTIFDNIRDLILQNYIRLIRCLFYLGITHTKYITQLFLSLLLKKIYLWSQVRHHMRTKFVSEMSLHTLFLQVKDHLNSSHVVERINPTFSIVNGQENTPKFIAPMQSWIASLQVRWFLNIRTIKIVITTCRSQNDHTIGASTF